MIFFRAFNKKNQILVFLENIRIEKWQNNRSKGHKKKIQHNKTEWENTSALDLVFNDLKSLNFRAIEK